jgi:hypothetical protein
MKDLVWENKENDEWIRELEEEIMQEKKDKVSLKEFNIGTKRVRIELCEMSIDMYENFQVFHQLEA